MYFNAHILITQKFNFNQMCTCTMLELLNITECEGYDLIPSPDSPFSI